MKKRVDWLKKAAKKRGNRDRQTIQPVLADLKKGLQELYGDELSKVILFGSYARGEARDDSDVDIMVLLKHHPVAKFQEIERIVDATFDIWLEHNQVFGVVPASELEWVESEAPLYRVVRKEGIPI